MSFVFKWCPEVFSSGVLKLKVLYILIYLIVVQGRGIKIMMALPLSEARRWKRSEPCINFTVSLTMQEE